MKSISCIIPTCDRGGRLLDAIQSAASQSRPPDEILVINNGSCALDLPHAIAGRVKVHEIVPYAGPSQARNFGAGVATGDYFAFLDDDEVWGDGYLEYACQAIDRGARLILGRLDERCADGVRPYKNAFGNLNRETILVRNPGINGSNLVVERTLFHELRGFDVKLPPSEDKSFALEAILRRVQIEESPESQVLLTKDDSVRLTLNPSKMADGVWQFTRKYRQYMTTDQLLLNVEKAYRYRQEAARAVELHRRTGRSSDDAAVSLSGQEKGALVERLLKGETIAAASNESGIGLEELSKWKQIGKLVTRLALMDAFGDGERREA